MQSKKGSPGAFGFLLALSVAATACGGNNNSTKSEEKKDSTVAATSSTDTVQPFRPSAEAILAPTTADTLVKGTAKFTADQQNGKVVMLIELDIPSKAGKSVAVHLHEQGDCGNMADMAHGHWNPGKTSHGKWGTGSFHAGDIGNIKLDKSGHGSLSLESSIWTIGGPPSTNILNKAVIVHGGEDDYKSQPAGNSGARIGCGVIQ
jgi:Cu-Zn family superoxide dismutase